MHGLDAEAIRQFNGFFMTDYQTDSFCRQSFLLTVSADSTDIYAQGDAGAHYAGLTLRRLSGDGAVPCCRIVFIPHMKNRQVVLRIPDKSEYGLFIQLLEEIAGLKYNSVYFRDLSESGMTSEQKKQLNEFCVGNFIRSNIGGGESEANFELDAASVVGFDLRTRYDHPEKITDAKISYSGTYTAGAFADSGFLFRLCAGAAALCQPDFGNGYWPRMLEGAMEYCYHINRRLSSAPVQKWHDGITLTLQQKTFTGGLSSVLESVESCDALEICHTLDGQFAFGEMPGRYILHYGDGPAREAEIVAGRNIGPSSAKWTHIYNPVSHAFDTDGMLKTICCYAGPEPYINEASEKITYYRLIIPGEGKIKGLSVRLRPGITLRIKSAAALYM